MERMQPTRSAGEMETRQFASPTKASYFGADKLNASEYENRKLKLTQANADSDGDFLNGSMLDLLKKVRPGLINPEQLAQSMRPRGYAMDVDTDGVFDPHQYNADFYSSGGFADKQFLMRAIEWPRFQLDGLDLSSWNDIFITDQIGMPYSRCMFQSAKGATVFVAELGYNSFAFKLLPKQGYLMPWVSESSFVVQVETHPNIRDGFVMTRNHFKADHWSWSTDEYYKSMMSDAATWANITEVIREVMGFLYFRAIRRIETQPIRGPKNDNVPPPLEGDAYSVVMVDLSTKHNTSTPKGGTHASPREHEREAHWRTYSSGRRVRIPATTVNKGVEGAVKKHYELKEKK